MSPHSPLASIDIGSNSILLLVGRMHQGKLQIQRQRKETIRLGGALVHRGSLKPRPWNAACNACAAMPS